MSIPSPSLPQTHSSSSPPLAFTSTVDIQQLIQDYNQCGARLLQAECLQQAHDLFRAALYLHVLAETGTSGNASVIHDTPDHVWGLAELHVAHEREYLKHHHNAQSPTSMMSRMLPWKMFATHRAATCPLSLQSPRQDPKPNISHTGRFALKHSRWILFQSLQRLAPCPRVLFTFLTWHCVTN